MRSRTVLRKKEERKGGRERRRRKQGRWAGRQTRLRADIQ